MKKYVSLFLVALLLCGCLSLFLVTPVSAASVPSYDELTPVEGWYYFEPGQVSEFAFEGFVYYPFVFSLSAYTDLEAFELPDQGDFDFSLSSGSGTEFLLGRLEFSGDFQFWILGYSFWAQDQLSSDDASPLNGGCYLYFAPGSSIQLSNFDGVLEAVSSNSGIYWSIEIMISDAFYGEGSTLTGWQELVVTVLATSAIVFMFALPFVLVFFLIKLIGGRR